MKKSIFLFFAAWFSLISFGQSTYELTVEKIMQDPSWIGTSPSRPFWTPGGDTLYFYWNPENNFSDSLYYVTLQDRNPVKATPAQKENVINAESPFYNNDRTAYVYAHNGDIFYKNVANGIFLPVTQTTDRESNPSFGFDEKRIIFRRGNDLFSWTLADASLNGTVGQGRLEQLTHFMESSQPDKDKYPELSREEEWLKKDQLLYMDVLKKRKEENDAAAAYRELHQAPELFKIYIGKKRISSINLSPDGRFVSYRLYQAALGNKNTIVPNYVTESGYTIPEGNRTKVGAKQGTSTFFIFDRQLDTVMQFALATLENIRYIPEFYKDYPKRYEQLKKENKVRPVSYGRTFWSPDGKYLAMDVRSQDNKDRWLILWDPVAGETIQADHQHDEAWIGGPGMWSLGWIDENTFWFQSEAAGYSHLYAFNIERDKKKALTSGNYEVQEARLSNDKKSFYITTNKVDPGQKQLYRLDIANGSQTRLTQMVGANESTFSPDEKMVAIIYSYSNKPWELYLKQNKEGATAEQITHKAAGKEWLAYPWRDPEVITFTARDGAQVHARIYKPENEQPGMPAVVFVHGAGYLQNAHKWWSHYFREFMFNNLLAENGYYVIDVDYRGSAGYGRDWRTAIYRHMGGKDLNDQVDAVKYLVKTYQVDPQKIGIYGGSYGGFITLMALFNEPEVFSAGAGLRSVTDWANYNHGYTSNILNEPYNDSIAYHQSSPIYFAEGLSDPLLMCHGLVDRNVHAQDIFKLSQRLIELKKEDWELAIYPVEDHGFEEPTSWMDEYRRIFKLFESVLK